MTTAHVFIAASLDGFVAREDHTIDWLMKQETEGEDHGFEEFAAWVDCIVMGRNSFQTVLGFDVDWPYANPVIVMSSTLKQADVPSNLQDKVEISDLSPTALMQSLDERGWARAYVDGGALVQSFMRAGLIDTIELTLIPILIGSGIRLFGELDADLDLELLGSKSFPSGLVTNKYAVKR